MRDEHMVVREARAKAMEPSPDDYEQAEREWNEAKSIGFDELDSFDQYCLAFGIANREMRV